MGIAPVVRSLLSSAFAAAAWGQAPLQSFMFTPPGSLVGNSGAPYSADEVHEHGMVDASGRSVSDPPSVRHVFRDSQGRKRTETPVSHSRLVVVEIEDPVGGFKYALDPETKIAHRYKVPNSRIYPIADHAAALMQPVRADQSPLGTQTMEGFMAIGTRTVVNLPHGPSTIDTWSIPELSVIVMTKNTLPRAGVFTMRLEHIRRDEPDVALFQVPAGYRVVDETGTFSFAITRR